MERRKRGTGQITQVKDPIRKKQWKATIIDERTGKTKNKYFETEKEAKAYLRELNANEKAKKLFLDGGGLTLNDYKNNYLEEKQSHMKPAPFETLKGTVEIISREIGNYRLKDIDNNTLQQLINTLAKKGNSQRTKSGYSESVLLKVKNTTIAILKRATAKGLLETLPVFDIIIPRQQKQAEKQAKSNYLKDEEIIRYEAEAVKTYEPKKYTKNYGKTILSHPNGYKLLFLLHTGIRLGEGIALTWSDYDEASKTLIINKNVVRTSEGKILQDTPKTESGERVIILNKKALEDIHNLRRQFDEQTEEIQAREKEELEKAAQTHEGQDLKAKRREIKEKFKAILDNHKYIFSAATYPYGMSGKDSINQSHQKIINEMNISHKVNTHGLRHSYVTHYYIHHCNDKDFDLATFSRMIGHSSIRTTMEIYAHLNIVEQRFIMRATEDLRDF